MKRYQIKAKIKSKQEKVEKLRQEIEELNKQNLLLSDKNQQYIEAYEDVPIGKRQKESKLVGRIHFKQKFIDEDTGQVVVIERKPVVRIDGEWI